MTPELIVDDHAAWRARTAGPRTDLVATVSAQVRLWPRAVVSLRLSRRGEVRRCDGVRGDHRDHRTSVRRGSRPQVESSNTSGASTTRWMSDGCRPDGLVENDEAGLAARGTALDRGRQLQPLRLAAGQLCGALAELELAKPDLVQGSQGLRELPGLGELLHDLGDGQFQHLIDGQSLIPDFQILRLVAPALARVADHPHICQEVHVDQLAAVIGADLAAAATRGVEAPAGPVPMRPVLRIRTGTPQ